MTRWTLDDVPWDQFDRSKVDPEILAVVRAACLVERNAPDYVEYLCNVFADDGAFQKKARAWGEEEVQHGEALGRWAELADSGFDYRESYRRFREGYRIPVAATASVRGSRAGELVARCVVETGTSSLYSALRDAAEEPVLKFICHKIAGDEFRHYKMFYADMKRYEAREKPSRLRRAWVAVGRFLEIGDDELPFAYHCGNEQGTAYDRRRAAAAYAGRAFRCYRRGHVERAVGMILKAVGLDPQGRISRLLTAIAWRFREWKVRGLSTA